MSIRNNSTKHIMSTVDENQVQINLNLDVEQEESGIVTIEPPRLSRIWQINLFMASLLAPSSMTIYGVTGNSFYFGMGSSLLSLSISTGILVFFSSPSNKSPPGRSPFSWHRGRKGL